jgi:hypothetical protein
VLNQNLPSVYGPDSVTLQNIYILVRKKCNGRQKSSGGVDSGGNLRRPSHGHRRWWRLQLLDPDSGVATSGGMAAMMAIFDVVRLRLGVRRRRAVGTTRLGSLARSGPLRGRSSCAGLEAMFTLSVARGDSSCSMLEWDTKVGLVGNGAGRGRHGHVDGGGHDAAPRRRGYSGLVGLTCLLRSVGDRLLRWRMDHLVVAAGVGRGQIRACEPRAGCQWLRSATSGRVSCA